MFMSLLALHDVARTCSRLLKEYKNNDGECSLDVHALWYGWKGNTTTEVIEVEEDDGEGKKTHPPWPKGFGIAHVLPLKDPLGGLLEEAGSFKEAAFVLANVCSLQIESFSELFKEHKDACDSIQESLLFMRLRTSFEIVSVNHFEQMQEKTEDNEDDETGKRLVLKLKEKSKKERLDKKDEEELGDLFDKLHVKSLPDELIRQLESLHVTDGTELWQYEDKSFQTIQEKKNDPDTSDED